MEGVLEGILFVVGNEGIDKDRLIDLLHISEQDLTKYIDNLKDIYKDEKHGLNIEYYANKYKLVTKKEHKEYYEKLVEVEKNDELSQSALETLAVVAYNSPVTRSYVDDIRGVDSSYQMRKLLYRNLIKEVGRAELPGRPILYSVTDEFLDYLGISSLEQLPELEEVEISEEKVTDLYNSKYKEN
ncbi:MAG TPA: SMC-Scp complex subunit ScpB [Bacilli bacterium]|nr:SMC-Scp complex subunit ScpB [Bacilli bacterium]